MQNENFRSQRLSKPLRKIYFENFYENVSEMLVGYHVGKGYNCLCNLFSDFEEASSSFKVA